MSELKKVDEPAHRMWPVCTLYSFTADFLAVYLPTSDVVFYDRTGGPGAVVEAACLKSREIAG